MFNSSHQCFLGERRDGRLTVFTCADQRDMWWTWDQRGCRASCCSTSLDRRLLTCRGHRRKVGVSQSFPHASLKRDTSCYCTWRKHKTVWNPLTSLGQFCVRTACWERKQPHVKPATNTHDLLLEWNSLWMNCCIQMIILLCSRVRKLNVMADLLHSIVQGCDAVPINMVTECVIILLP